MIGYVVPHSKYPAGYHCDPKQPLPFMGFASQKIFIAVYHMGVYADNKLHKRFAEEYARAGIGKLDMAKVVYVLKIRKRSLIKLIGELASKVTPDEWIAVYEKFLTAK